MRWISLGNTIISFIFSILNAEMVSAVCGFAMEGDTKEVLKYSFALLFVFGLMVFLPGVCEAVGMNMQSVSSQNLRCYVYELINKNHSAVLGRYDRGELKENLSDDLNNVIHKYASLYPKMIGAILGLLGYFIYLFMYSPIVAVTMLLFSSIQLFPPYVVKKFLQKSYEDTRDIEAEISDCILEGIQGFATIKLWNLKNWWIRRIERLNKDYIKIGKKSIYTSEIQSAMFLFVQNVLKYGLYGVLGVYLLKQMVSYEVAIKAIAISGAFFPLVGEIGMSLSRLVVDNAAEKRLFVFDMPDNELKQKVTGKTIEINHLVLLRNEQILLDWKEKRLVLDGIYVIHGNNGIGKSTLLDALVGKYIDYEGEIKIGGIDVKELSDENFPQKICYLSQRDYSLEMTVNEFVEACLIEPSKQQIALDIVGKFGLSIHEIGNRPTKELSGGERRKVFLAVALAHEPEILILDEPTNSLDQNGKNVLLEELRKLDSTILIVSHEEIEREFEAIRMKIQAGGITFE